MRSVIPQNALLVPSNAELVFTGIIFDVYQWEQKLFDGSYATFEMLKRPDTVVIIAVKDDKLVIIHEQQPGKKPYYSLPCGRHDVDSETELDAAKRELVEETGFSFKKWKLLSVHQPQPKIEAFVYIFLATDFSSEATQNLDAGEKIDVLVYDFVKAKDILLDQNIDSGSIKIFEKVNSLSELLNLPSYHDK